MYYEYQFKDRDVALQTYKMARQYYNRGSEVIRLQNSTIFLNTDDTGRLESLLEKFNASCKRRRIGNGSAIISSFS